jgi:hypothetical protein
MSRLSGGFVRASGNVAKEEANGTCITSSCCIDLMQTLGTTF